MEMAGCALGPRHSLADHALGYDQKLRRLAALATEASTTRRSPGMCRKRSTSGSSATCTRATLPTRRGTCCLTTSWRSPRFGAPGAGPARRPRRRVVVPADHVRPRASVTTYPVYLGDLDKVLAPFVDERSATTSSTVQAAPVLDRHSTGCSPMRSCTPTSARTTAASPARSSASNERCARSYPTSR